MIKLSIVIPVYNVERYLSKCLDSVLPPGETDYEILIVNDGSTDASRSIAERYRERQPETITLIHTENRGLGSARNTGMRNAKGEYLYFLDSDDYLAPDGLRRILSSLDGDYDIYIFDSITVSESGRELAYVPGCTVRGAISLSSCPELLVQIPNVWNKVFRRSLFSDSGIVFPDRAWFEDVRTVLKLYALTDRIFYIPEAWHRYLLREGSIMNSARVLRNLEMIEAIDDLTGFYRERGLAEAYGAELEYLAFYDQFLTSSVRVNLADPRSPVQDKLMRDFLEKYPDFSANPYVQKISARHRLLTWLLLHRMRHSVHCIMKLNEIVKRKKS